MTFNKGLFKSERLDHKTPEELLTKLDQEFGFDFDPCPANPDFDGLKVKWGKCNFVNPPYGREIEKWCIKAVYEWKCNKTVVMLIASRTDTRWWHDYIMQAHEIRFIRGRLKFSGQKNSAPFPSAIAIFFSKEEYRKRFGKGDRGPMIVKSISSELKKGGKYEIHR